MKSKKLILVVAAATMAFASQHANAQWQLTGNAGTDTAVNFVGTTNNTGFKIKTNNIDRVWVGTNGRVGINTVAPVNNLDVVNNGAVTMGIRSNTAGATMSMDRGLGTTNAAFAYKSLGVVLWNSGILGNDNFTIRNAAAGTNAMVITPLNNVGIGTGAPTQKLDVNGNINANGVMYATGGNSTNWNSAYGWGNHATAGYITSENDPQVGTNTFGYVPRWDGSALTTGAIYDNGYVGIGTSAPTQLLDITATSAFIQVKGTSSWAGIVLDKATSLDNEYVIHRTAGSDKWVEGMMGNDNFTIRNWATASNALTISNTNNHIGIGTAAPNYLLEVQGNAAGSSYFNIYSKVNYVGTSDIRGLYAYSKPADGYGYGVDATGGYYGGSFNGDGGAYGGGVVGVAGYASGSSGTRYGVFGSAYNSGGAAWGGYFVGNTYAGNLMVNTTTPGTGYALTVGGKIICTELKVQLMPFPDYVFDKSYNLKSIEEVEAHVAEFHRLPGMPSACEVEDNGMEVGEMQGKIVEKVEEMMLYIIQLKNENKTLLKRIELLEKN